MHNCWKLLPWCMDNMGPFAACSVAACACAAFSSYVEMHVGAHVYLMRAQNRISSAEESSEEGFPSLCPGAGDAGRHQGNAARSRTSAPGSGGPPRGASRSGSESGSEGPPPLESVSGLDDDAPSGDGDGRGRGCNDPSNHANSEDEENEERSSEDDGEDRDGTEPMRINLHWCLLCASMLRLLLLVSLPTWYVCRASDSISDIV